MNLLEYYWKWGKNERENTFHKTVSTKLSSTSLSLLSSQSNLCYTCVYIRSLKMLQVPGILACSIYGTWQNRVNTVNVGLFCPIWATYKYEKALVFSYLSLSFFLSCCYGVLSIVSKVRLILEGKVHNWTVTCRKTSSRNKKRILTCNACFHKILLNECFLHEWLLYIGINCLSTILSTFKFYLAQPCIPLHLHSSHSTPKYVPYLLLVTGDSTSTLFLFFFPSPPEQFLT